MIVNNHEKKVLTYFSQRFEKLIKRRGASSITIREYQYLETLKQLALKANQEHENKTLSK